MKYLGNLLSSAPFAYAMGVSKLIMGSTFEPLEDKPSSNMDGANPELSNSIKFSGITFAEQDGLLTRRSKKVQNIADWFNKRNVTTKLWACSSDKPEQCSKCLKCIRTQLNLCVQNKIQRTGDSPILMKNGSIALYVTMNTMKKSLLVMGYYRLY